MIIDGADAELVIDQDVIQRAMYVVREGIVTVGEEVEHIDGIFVLGDHGRIDAERVRNDDAGEPWNTAGGITINGVLVGESEAIK